MINKENKDEDTVEKSAVDNNIDVARIDMQCHILIKDKETGEVLVNKRG